MSWKRKLELAVEGFLILVMCWAIYQAHFWPRETRLFPQLVGALVLILTTIALVSDILRFRRSSHQTAPSVDELIQEEADLTDGRFAGRAGTEFVWLVGYGVLVWFGGFYPATFVYLLLYFWQRANFSLIKSLAGSAIATGTVVGVFYYLLQVEPYTGLLGDWMAR